MSELARIAAALEELVAIERAKAAARRKPRVKPPAPKPTADQKRTAAQKLRRIGVL